MFAKLLLALIRLYQLTWSPFVGRSCRFVPSCSNYGLEAIEKFGAIRGGYLTIRRLLRCHPLGGQGYDPVPKDFSWKVTQQTHIQRNFKTFCACCDRRFHLFKFKK